ncbi:hypothetical protein SSTU70S_04034 [Stutzerimonas stutzeri]
MSYSVALEAKVEMWPPRYRVGDVGAHHHRQGVPAYQRADAAFHEQVAGHACFVGDGDGVAVRRGDRVGQLGTTAGGQLAHPGHQVMGALLALAVEDGLQGVQPFLGFDGIETLHGLLQGGKASRIGCLLRTRFVGGSVYMFLDMPG